MEGATRKIIDLKFDGQELCTFKIFIPDHLEGEERHDHILNELLTHIWWVERSKEDEE